jgi:hypothetical protein
MDATGAWFVKPLVIIVVHAVVCVCTRVRRLACGEHARVCDGCAIGEIHG